MNKQLIQEIHMNQLGEIFLTENISLYGYLTIWLSENIKKQTTYHDYFDEDNLMSRLLLEMNITYLCDL